MLVFKKHQHIRCHEILFRPFYFLFALYILSAYPFYFLFALYSAYILSAYPFYFLFALYSTYILSAYPFYFLFAYTFCLPILSLLVQVIGELQSTNNGYDNS